MKTDDLIANLAADAGPPSPGRSLVMPLAFAGARHGVPVTIVMPKPTPTVKVTQTEGHGATVILEGETFDAAYAHARKLEAERGYTFVHQAVTRDNYRELLTPFLTRGGGRPFIVNLSVDTSSLDLIYVGTKKDMLMIEGSADQLPEDKFIEALEFGHQAIQPIITAIEELVRIAGKAKSTFPLGAVTLTMTGTVARSLGERSRAKPESSELRSTVTVPTVSKLVPACTLPRDSPRPPRRGRWGAMRLICASCPSASEMLL